MMQKKILLNDEEKKGLEKNNKNVFTERIKPEKKQASVEEPDLNLLGGLVLSCNQLIARRGQKAAEGF